MEGVKEPGILIIVFKDAGESFSLLLSEKNIATYVLKPFVTLSVNWQP